VRDLLTTLTFVDQLVVDERRAVMVISK
jgi:hypothetical protein